MIRSHPARKDRSMILRHSPTSPYVRKVRMVALEAGLDSHLELVPTLAWAPDTDLPKDNPLGKVPCLVTDGGEAIYDSPVICEYLDSLHGGRKLVPAGGGERWRHLRLQALGDGILDAALLVRIENSMRPEDKRWPGWVDRQTAAVTRGIDALEQEAAQWGDEFLIGQIAVVAALDYLDFRAILDWRAGRPAAWTPPPR
jgi:glutathione S-transferase